MFGGGISKLAFNGSNQNIQNRTDNFRIVVKEITDSHWKGENPLTNWNFWKYVIDEMSRNLCHVACIAGRANAPSFTGEGYERIVAALTAMSSCKSVGENATFQK